MKKVFLLMAAALMIVLKSNSVYSANEQFRSFATGDWSSNSTWEMSTNGGGTWIGATSPPSDTNGITTIRSPHTVTVTSNASIDQFTVNTGGQISINSGINLTLLDGSGTDLTLNGGGIISGAGSVRTQGADEVLLIQNGSSFNAHLKVNSGTATAYDNGTPFTAKFNGEITIEFGATLNVNPGGYSIQANNNVTNNGTIAGPSNSTFIFGGPTLTNNGSITPVNFRMDSTSSLAGTGSYTSNTITIGSSGNISLSSNVTFSPVTSFTVNTGGVLNPNSNTFTYNSGTFILNPGATVLNSGAFQTQGTPSLNIKNSSSFNAHLKVNSGITTAFDNGNPFTAKLNGEITIEFGATLNVNPGGYAIQANNNITNNGTIAGPSNSAFLFRGPTLTNNGSITPANFQMDSTSSLAGTGTYTSNTVTIGSSGNISLSNNVTFSPITSFTVNLGGVLNPNSNTFTYNSGTFILNPGATVSNSGAFQTQGTPSLNIRNGSSFNAPLKVNTGITNANDAGASPWTATFNNEITIDSGATLNVNAGGYAIRANNNVINNGTISGSTSMFRFFGANFMNNGVVNTTTFNFETGIHTLQGTGSWTTGANFITGSVVTLASNHQMRNIDVNSGGSFDITSRSLLLSGPITPIINNGTFSTAGSTIVYNGTAAQAITTANVTYNNLTINNSAGVTLSSAESVPGILTLTTGVFTIGANLTLGTGATIVKENGSLSGTPTFGTSVYVIYIGTNAATSGTELPSSGTVLKNLTINNSGGVTLSAARTVNDSLILMNGIFSNGPNLSIANGATIIRINGTLNSAPSFNTTVNVVYSGANSTTTGNEIPSSTNTLSNLSNNNTGGIIVSGNMTVNAALTLTGSDIDLNGQTITLGSTANLVETPGNTVKGSSGSITTTRDLNNISLNVAGLGAVLTTAQNMGSTIITRIHSQQTGNGNNSILRSYDITPTNNTGLNATLEFNYDESELNSIPEANLTLFRSINAGTNWALRGGTVNTTNNNVTLTGISSLSRWTLGNKDNPLVLENLQLTVLIEGFYVQAGNTMVPDTVRAYLRNTFAPYSIIDSAIALLSSTGVGLYTFKYATDEINYYIQLKHRNSLETWSKFGNSFTSSTLSYDFTTDSAKAFGDNLKRVDDSPVEFAVYSGDVNQNGAINLNDILEIYNNATNFVGGYVSTDVTGDNSTNLADLLITYNNTAKFIVKITP